eukprot:g2175.t1
MSAPRVVFRALHRSQDSSTDIRPKAPKARVSIDAAVGQKGPTQYVLATTNVFVALYYAEEFGSRNSAHTIVAIDTKRLNGVDAIDLTDGHDDLTSFTAKNHASAHKIVLIDGTVPSSAILDSLDTRPIDIGKEVSGYDKNGRPFQRTRADDDEERNSFVEQIPWTTCQELDEWARQWQDPVFENSATRSTSRDGSLPDGRFKKVSKGRYVRGNRAGYPSVNKKSKSEFVKEDIFWSSDLASIKHARRLIEKFNINYVSPQAFINDAQVWKVLPQEIEKVLVEPYISGKFVNFNSNTGYENPQHEFMAGLAHFSYHFTKGDYLLCDLQGTTYNYLNADGETVCAYVLTDPVIHSRKQGRFGPADFGQNGIDNFFGHHRCGRFCKESWRKPPDARKIYDAVRGSCLITKTNQLVGTSKATTLPDICEESDEYDVCSECYEWDEYSD